MKKELYLVGLSHKNAPVEVRERFALSDPDVLERGILPLDGDIREYLVLSTCNRVEMLAVAHRADCTDMLLEYWARARGEHISSLQPYVYIYTNEDAVRHLFTVASSLDSMVLGEPQILGQLKDAYRAAAQRRTTKAILNKLLHKAFSVAKRVRTETAIAASAVSVSYAAVELARKIFDDMGQIQAMLIGAGEMAELAATHLVNAGIASIRVANRTHERAVQLADRYGGRAVFFDDLTQHLSQVDIVISSTGAREPIIRVNDMREVLRKRKNKPMFFIDIAVPRDIDPEVNSLDNIYLYDIDDLKEVVEENLAGRREEAVRAQRIVAEETGMFCLWLKSLNLQPTIVDMIRKSETIAQLELERSLKRLGPLPEGSREILAAMLSSVVKKLNHEPIMFLKRHIAEEADADDYFITLFRRIFNLDVEAGQETSHHKRRCYARQTSSSRSELS
ncbi:MAG: glutamyl-tRNA reductase [Desulfovibrio sp.]|jgi:glutamyl-tRNA reductase|nr:glutamyl-tRNA reductase [Desulfovibrio sp.]